MLEKSLRRSPLRPDARAARSGARPAPQAVVTVRAVMASGGVIGIERVPSRKRASIGEASGAHAVGVTPAAGFAQTAPVSSRRAHRRSILRDRDALHALGVAGTALLLSGGLLYVGYLGHVWRVARRAPTQPLPVDGGHGPALVFGKHCVDGRPDADFRARIARAHALAQAGAVRELLLLGGGPGPTEADVAARALRAAGVPDGVTLVLEDASRDTLENLRNARRLLAGRPPAPAILVSSRYHLARCALFARTLGMPHSLCAAEPHWRAAPAPLLRLLGEAAYVMWVDVGARWARLIGHRRMLAKLR